VNVFSACAAADGQGNRKSSLAEPKATQHCVGSRYSVRASASRFTKSANALSARRRASAEVPHLIV
jgi:hypothetical protein